MSVINDVINNVKDDFSEEGVEEQVLQELKKVGINMMHFRGFHVRTCLFFPLF